MKCLIIDYGIGNIGSIVNMFKHIGVSADFTADIDKIRQADCYVLPGVGSYDKGVQQLNESGLIPVLTEQVLELKKPLLGICLGMQLLVDSSEEGSCLGLGWIPGSCQKFSSSQDMKVPHMGWKSVCVKSEDGLFNNLAFSRYYFVHSYYVECQPKHILAESIYGKEFVSAIQRDNIYGVQFHPEKSHRYGMQMLKNFVERC